MKLTAHDKNEESKESTENNRKKFSDISNKLRKNSSSTSMSFSINPLKHIGSFGNLLHHHHHHTITIEPKQCAKFIFR